MITLTPDAENNAFASMLAELLRQNLETKPHKKKDFDALSGTVAIIADDAEVALTLEFKRGALVVHDGIKGKPDLAVRGTGDAIMSMSNVPLTRSLGLPLPTDRASLELFREMVHTSTSGALEIYGMLGNLKMLFRLTKVMSVNG